jgi:hypothetical protein
MSTSLYQQYGNDKAAEVEHGIELRFADAKFFVRRAGGANQKYNQELRRLTRPLRKQIQIDVLEDNAYDELNKKAYFRAVVIGWENVNDADGNYITFSEANFVKLMTDLPDLWDALQDACTRLSNFRAEEIRQDGEDLGNSSAGIRSGAS